VPIQYLMIGRSPTWHAFAPITALTRIVGLLYIIKNNENLDQCHRLNYFRLSTFQTLCQMLLTLTPWLVCVLWTPLVNACSIYLQNKYKTTARLLSILIILVSFLGYDKDKNVESGRTLRRSMVWIYPKGFCQEVSYLKPASAIN